ncbi:CBS domain-containing protein [Nanoarchaeota archaeon]
MNIKSRRKKAGLTQIELASEAGVSQSMIAKIEAGLLDPAYTKMQKILQALDGVEKNNEAKAKEIMNPKVNSVRRDDKLIKVIKKMQAAGISQMPVVEGSVVGMVTEKGIMERIEDDVRTLRVVDVMVEAPAMVGEDAPLTAVNELLKHYQIVIVQKEGNLKGVIAKSDIIKSLL